MGSEPDDVALQQTAADRLDDLAEMADLMGDAVSAVRFREQAVARRMLAMRLLDD